MKDTEAIEILKQMRKDTPTMSYECLMNKEMEALDTILLSYKLICDELDKKKELINKIKWTITADRMEQFDDYVIYLQTKYLEILGENEDE